LTNPAVRRTYRIRQHLRKTHLKKSQRVARQIDPRPVPPRQPHLRSPPRRRATTRPRRARTVAGTRLVMVGGPTEVPTPRPDRPANASRRRSCCVSLERPGEGLPDLCRKQSRTGRLRRRALGWRLVGALVLLDLDRHVRIVGPGPAHREFAQRLDLIEANQVFAVQL